MKPSLILYALALLFFSACSGGETEQADNVPEVQPPAAPVSGTVDVSGVAYPTLQWEGGPVWLGQNLSIEVENSWCYQSSESCPQLGRFYRWEAAKEACANIGEGWRLPSREEWETLANHYGGFQDWLSTEPNGDPQASNSALIDGGISQMNLVLNGRRGSNGGFEGKTEYGFYWSSAPSGEVKAVSFQVQKDGASLNKRDANQRMGFMCRCVR